jgi:hypothetical protein
MILGAGMFITAGRTSRFPPSRCRQNGRKSHSTVKHGEKKILKNYLITHNSDELVLKIRKNFSALQIFRPFSFAGGY